MSKNKSSDFVKYKFRALKTYTSTEWLAESKKKYRQVFDKSEIRYIYAEFSFYNKLFDEEDWEAEIMLVAYKDGTNAQKVSKDLVVSKKITKDQNVVYIREGWGNDKVGVAWQEGAYYWEVFIDGEKVSKHNFYVYDVGEVTGKENPYLDIEAVRLYEGPNKNLPKAERNYYQDFNSKDTRFVWIEFLAENKLDRPWMAELVFNFYNDARQLKGQTIELVKIKKNQKNVEINSGWGSDHRGTWFVDNYTVEIVFMDTLIGVLPFTVGEDFVEGDNMLLRPDENRAILGVPAPPDLENLSLDEVLTELDGLIGLESIKNRIKEYAQYLNFLKLRQEKGFKDNQPINLHAVFTGNPGTGKTTVARMLGKIYKKLGLLTKGHIHEVDRSDIIGEYIGQTAPKVKAAIDRAKGGILFIDEAYSLARKGDDTKDYGREVIELLVKEMSEGKGDMAVVVAGYPREMDTFLESNPGLKSRFNMKFNFPDYTPEELEEISAYWAEKRFVTFSKEAQNYLSYQLVESYRKRDRSFGNARYVLSIIDEAKMNLGLRVMQQDNADSLEADVLSLIEMEDIQKVFEPAALRKINIPVDEELLQEALKELNALIGLQKVKTEVLELVKLVKFYKEIGKDVLNSFSLHTVFTGNPGTGKTTVARIIGKIYKALGILERGSIVECDRQQLVAGFSGQTAIKTADIIEQAKGSVLFIDEAYTLSKGPNDHYGHEAIETLLKRMEDLRGEMIVIAAGYPENMRRFLETNPGLKSRFDRKFDFPDYTDDQLLSIAKNMFSDEGVDMENDAEKHLADYFTHLYRYKNKFFGNARAVRKVVEKAIKNQHLRLASIPTEKRTAKMLNVLTLKDVEEFTQGNDNLMESGKQGRVGF